MPAMKSAPQRRALLAAVLAWVSLTGCATYSDKALEARQAATRGDYAEAARLYSDAAGVDDATETPSKWNSERALAVLERGTALQASEDFVSSARDFGLADQELELLDIANDVGGDIGRYTYSDSAASYRIPPSEKLALNAFNMLNYLSVGDLAGAEVEAKRFTVMRNYLLDFDPDHAHGSMGSYLAGFVSQQRGAADGALRFYDDALDAGKLDTLRGPVRELAAISPYRGRNLATLLESGIPSAGKGPSEILIVVSAGRVPYKEPRRIQVGLAVGIAGTFITGNPDVLSHLLTKFVVYPELVDADSRITEATVRLDGREIRSEVVADLAATVRREYEQIKPRIIGAAISRLIARAVVAEGVRAAGNQASGGVGLLAALLAEGTLVALDKPDTRSWELLPARVWVARRRVAPGAHEIVVDWGKGDLGRRVVTVEVSAGEAVVVAVTEPR